MAVKPPIKTPQTLINDGSRTLFTRLKINGYDKNDNSKKEYASGCVLENGTVMISTYTGCLEYYLTLDEFLIKYKLFNGFEIIFLDASISIEDFLKGEIS